jgi:hypothetical protein
MTMIRASIAIDDCSKKKSNSVSFSGKVNKVYTNFSLQDVASHLKHLSSFSDQELYLTAGL